MTRYMRRMIVLATMVVFFCGAPYAGSRAEDASAHRPSLWIGQTVGKETAEYLCWNKLFPIDPYEQRCRVAGVEDDGGAGGERKLCGGHGHANGAWCFPRSWATNNNFRSYRFQVRISYVANGSLKVYRGYSTPQLWSEGSGG